MANRRFAFCLLPLLAAAAGVAPARAQASAQTTTQTTAAAAPAAAPRPGITGDFEIHAAFPSRFLPTPRNLIVYLPPGYQNGAQRYPVFYMHDGQNLFDPATAFAGNEWH